MPLKCIQSANFNLFYNGNELIWYVFKIRTNVWIDMNRESYNSFQEVMNYYYENESKITLDTRLNILLSEQELHDLLKQDKRIFYGIC